MADKKIRLLVQAEVSKAVKNLNRLEKETDETKQSANELTSAFKTMFGAAVLGAGAKSVINTAATFETLRTRLVALKGSAEEGAKAFDAFTEIAATTPFQVKNVVEAGATLEAFGVSSEDTLKSIADLAAFMGTDIVDASAAFGRAFAGGAGAADILRERGILQLIKDAEGIDDLSELTLPEFREALERAMTDPDGKIAGATDLLAETFNGKVSNMQDSVDVLQNAIGSELLDSLGDLATFVGDAARSAADFVENLSEEKIQDIERALKIITGMGSAYLLYTKGAMMARAATLGLIRAAKFLLIFEAIELIIINVSKNFEFFTRKVKEAHLAIAEFFQSKVLDHIGTAFRNMPDSVALLNPGLVALRESFESLGIGSGEAADTVNRLKGELAEMPETAFEMDWGNLREMFEFIAGDENIDTEALRRELDEAEKAYNEYLKSLEKGNDKKKDSDEESLRHRLETLAAEGKITRQNALSTIKAKSKESTASYIASIFKGVGFPMNILLAGLASAAIDELFKPLMKFPTGGSFITNKRTTLPIGNGVIVGDNASGMERVDITPLPAPNTNEGNITININAPVVDEYVVDSIIPAIERARKLNL